MLLSLLTIRSNCLSIVYLQQRKKNIFDEQKINNNSTNIKRMVLVLMQLKLFLSLSNPKWLSCVHCSAVQWQGLL